MQNLPEIVKPYSGPLVKIIILLSVYVRLAAIFVSGQPTMIKYDRVRKTIRARYNYIHHDDFYIEVDYF